MSTVNEQQAIAARLAAEAAAKQAGKPPVPKPRSPPIPASNPGSTVVLPVAVKDTYRPIVPQRMPSSPPVGSSSAPALRTATLHEPGSPPASLSSPGLRPPRPPPPDSSLLRARKSEQKAMCSGAVVNFLEDAGKILDPAAAALFQTALAKPKASRDQAASDALNETSMNAIAVAYLLQKLGYPFSENETRNPFYAEAKDTRLWKLVGGAIADGKDDTAILPQTSRGANINDRKKILVALEPLIAKHYGLPGETTAKAKNWWLTSVIERMPTETRLANVTVIQQPGGNHWSRNAAGEIQISALSDGASPNQESLKPALKKTRKGMYAGRDSPSSSPPGPWIDFSAHHAANVAVLQLKDESGRLLDGCMRSARTETSEQQIDLCVKYIGANIEDLVRLPEAQWPTGFYRGDDGKVHFQLCIASAMDGTQAQNTSEAVALNALKLHSKANGDMSTGTLRGKPLAALAESKAGHEGEQFAAVRDSSERVAGTVCNVGALLGMGGDNAALLSQGIVLDKPIVVNVPASSTAGPGATLLTRAANWDSQGAVLSERLAQAMPKDTEGQQVARWLRWAGHPDNKLAVADTLYGREAGTEGVRFLAELRACVAAHPELGPALDEWVRMLSSSLQLSMARSSAGPKQNWDKAVTEINVLSLQPTPSFQETLAASGRKGDSSEMVISSVSQALGYIRLCKAANIPIAFQCKSGQDRTLFLLSLKAADEAYQAAHHGEFFDAERLMRLAQKGDPAATQKVMEFRQMFTMAAVQNAQEMVGLGRGRGEDDACVKWNEEVNVAGKIGMKLVGIDSDVRQPGLYMFSGDAYREARLPQLLETMDRAAAEKVIGSELSLMGLGDTAQEESLFGVFSPKK